MTWEEEEREEDHERFGREESWKETITRVARRMETHVRSVATQEDGCWVVSKALWDRRVTPGDVFSSGALDAVLAAMKQHKRAATVQGKGCHILHNLCKTDMNVRDAIAARGGIGRILDALVEHPYNADVQSFGCGALWNLAMIPGAAGEAAFQLGGVQIVVDRLAAPLVMEKTLEYGVGALSGMLRKGDPLALGDFSAGDGVGVVLFAMRTHPGNVYLQRNGCLALAYACRASMKCQEAFLKADGLGPVTETLLRYYRNDITFDNACRAIIAVFTYEVPPSAMSVFTPELMSLLESQCFRSRELRGRGRPGAAAASRRSLCIQCLEVLWEHGVAPTSEWAFYAPFLQPAPTQPQSGTPDDEAALLNPDNIIQNIYSSKYDKYGNEDGWVDENVETISCESSPHSPVHDEVEQDKKDEEDKEDKGDKDVKQDEDVYQSWEMLLDDEPSVPESSGVPDSTPVPEKQP